MKKQFLLALLTLSIAAPIYAQETLADRARSALTAFKVKAKHYGRKAYGYGQRGIKEGVALMVLGENLVQEAVDGLKKLEQKRDEIVAFGKEAEAKFNKLVDALQTVQNEASRLYDQGMNIVEDEASNN